MSRTAAAKPPRWRPGPGLLVTAAFLGPGTLATASRAGSAYGLALLWTLTLAVAAAIVLQEMAARLGVVGRLGLAEAIRRTVRPPWARTLALGLVLVAIVFGNTAYQTGNLLGAGLGVQLLLGFEPGPSAAVLATLVAALLALGDRGSWLTSGLMLAVAAMSFAFVATAVAVRPPVAEVIQSAVWVSLPEGAALTAVALFGTTVVPYNLFLHAAGAKKRWAREPAGDPGATLLAARWDTAIAIPIGGLVTASIVVTAATAFPDGAPRSAVDLAGQLGPLLGSWAEKLFACGLLAAGLTSAVTAPWAAGYAAAEALPGAGPRTTRWVAAAVCLTGGALAALLGGSPQTTIVVAQAANGLLLPLVACFLLWVMNQESLLGARRNGWRANAAGAAVVAAATGLGLVSLWRLAP